MNHSDQHMIKCIGCGAYLQTTDSKKEGFVPQTAFNHIEEDPSLYCQRCFKLRHYNELMDVELEEDQYKNLLNDLSTQAALIVLVLDLFDFEGSYIAGIQRFAMNNKILVLANKFDLLPKSTKPSRIGQWVMKRSHQLGLRPDQVLVTSAKKNQYIKEVMETIDQLRLGQDVYLIGASNVGKSTLLNAILSQSLKDNQLITTSYFPGTTLGKIEIPLDDGSVLIDTPGIIQTHQMNYYLKGKDLKAISPKQRLKPKSYQLDAGQTIMLGGLARIDLNHCTGKSPMVVYTAEGVHIHRTKTVKAEEVYQSLLGQVLMPPHQPQDLQLKWTSQSFKLEEDRDIVISGLGWIRCSGQTTVRVWAPKEVRVFIRPPLI